MRYSDSSVDRVREADIVKTIDSFTNITLKRQGSVYKCKSPFNSKDSTPSFTVSPSKNIFKCFSTGLGGDAIKFVMLYNKVDFIEAIEVIAKIHNIFLEKQNVTPEVLAKLDRKAEMLKLLEKASRGYVAAFNKLDINHWAKKLLVEREFTTDSLIDFQVGYVDNENKLTKWTIGNGTLAVSKDLGLSKTNNNSSYDLFRNRIMFPIHNDKGNVVGFGGRQANDPTLDKSFKYINTKESLVYNKSAVLYGLFQAKHTISKTGAAILTEGYTDVIAMHQSGCDNTVASCGTALTNQHALLLKKYAEEVVLLRDGDKAGLNTMLKKGGDIDILLSHGLNVSICLLPDGEDPDTFSRVQLDMHTWVQSNKQDAILYKANNYDVTRERYEIEVQEIRESITKQTKVYQDEIIELEGLEGDDKTKAKAHNKTVLNQIATLKKQGQQEIKDLQKIDPSKKSDAVTDIAETLFRIKHEIKRTEYIKQVSKLLKVSIAALKSEIGNFEVKQTAKANKGTEKLPMKGIALPDGASKEEYMEGHGFVTVNNSYHFLRINSSTFFQGTNFKLQPLFHIQGEKENKRLCEIINLKGKKKLIDFDSDMLANFAEFRKYLFRIGGFLFLTHQGVRTEHFDKLVYRFEEEFEPALELITLGWIKKGFFAFANGVFWEGKFRSVNQYGIITLEGIDETATDYNQKIDNYYSPAFSVMHINNQDGDDKYENDRYFVYKEASVTLQEWMDKMLLVFQEKGLVGVLFNFAGLFRDLFLSHYDFFPLLGGFGEKDSGKSAFGKILQNFFYYRLPPLDLTQATHVGFSRRLSRNTNTVQFADEYQDKNIRDDVFNGLMGTWNGIGREKGKGVGTNRTSYDKVNSAVYYAGQFIPNKMENALATRTISMFFKNKNYSPQEKTNFANLLNCTNSGISSLTIEILKHRGYFEKRLPQVHAESERTLKEELKDQQYQERIFGNVSVLFTTYQILKDKIKFPAAFTEEEIKRICVDLIIENSDQIADSNGLTEFWNIVTFLFENKRISSPENFIIEKPTVVKIYEKKQSKEVNNQDRDEIIYLRLKSVYQYYSIAASSRENVDVIGETTLQNYFKSRPYFIGLVKAKRFGKAGASSCYAFNYTKMKKKGLLNLQEDVVGGVPEHFI